MQRLFFIAGLLTSLLGYSQCGTCDYLNPTGALTATSGQTVCYTTSTTSAGNVVIQSGAKLQICGGYTEVFATGSWHFWPGSVMELFNCTRFHHTGSFVDFGVNAVQAYCPFCNDVKYEEDYAIVLDATVDVYTPSWSCIVTLPVELISFTIVEVNNQPVLSWKTGSELNNSFFDVEYSSDGVTWESQTVIEGAGTTSEVSHYAWLIENYTSGYFRLKQVDIDGTESYSQWVSVQNQSDLRVQMIQSNEAPKAIVKSDGVVNIQIYGLSGQLMFSQKFSSTTSGLEVDLSQFGLSSGMYLLKVNSETRTTSHRFLIK